MAPVSITCKKLLDLSVPNRTLVLIQQRDFLWENIERLDRIMLRKK